MWPVGQPQQYIPPDWEAPLHQPAQDNLQQLCMTITNSQSHPAKHRVRNSGDNNTSDHLNSVSLMGIHNQITVPRTDLFGDIEGGKRCRVISPLFWLGLLSEVHNTLICENYFRIRVYSQCPMSVLKVDLCHFGQLNFCWPWEMLWRQLAVCLTASCHVGLPSIWNIESFISWLCKIKKLSLINLMNCNIK